MPDAFDEILSGLPRRTIRAIQESYARGGKGTVYAGYNAGTWYATHQMRSAASAFRLLAHLNRTFQHQFTPSPN